MNIEELRAYCLSKKYVTECLPFDNVTLVFKVANKMFVIVPLDNWEKGEASVTLKCDPEYTLELRGKYVSIFAGSYVNNKHWNTVLINTGELQNDFVIKLIDLSYNLVVKGMTKKLQKELGFL
ncbi:MAG: MmcQ/YjbR family DNA-binding protein [Lutibacter sp.]|nr:MmcQ/YjbR family DNA-binding protein [Lutibacter sp.]